jgi:hypothetical protein
LYLTFQDKIDNIGLKDNRTHLIYENDIKILKEYLNKMDIFYYTLQVWNNESKITIPHKHIVKLVYALKILKLNSNYYKY